MWMKQLDRAAREVEMAIKLDPNFADAYAAQGQIKTYAGKPAEGIGPLRKAMRLDPHYRDVFLHFLGLAHYMCGQYDEAVETLLRRLVRQPDTDITRVLLASCYGHLGDIDKAREQWAAVLEINPSYSLERRRSVLPFKDPADFEKIVNGLREAGLPEESPQQNEPLPLPDKPSIAVLPFENMSGDPEQEYFADGMAEDIITALSRIRQFFVIARNTTFTYKGQAVDVQAVARELGVRYVLEGSVRKSGNRVRITAQLIDGKTGSHIWAERFDRDLEDIFALQDEITQSVVGAILPEITIAELERAKAKPPDRLDAWDFYLRGKAQINLYSRDNIFEAVSLLQRAIELDPEFALAHATLGLAYRRLVTFDYVEDHHEVQRQARQAAERAVALDKDDAEIQVALGWIYFSAGEIEEAVSVLEKAVELNPSHASAHSMLGGVLGTAGRAEEGIAHHQTAIRLSPRDPSLAIMLGRYANTLIVARRYEEAAEMAKSAIRLSNGRIALAFGNAISALGHLGRIEEAQALIERLKELHPNFGFDTFRQAVHYTNPDDQEHHLDGFRKAGLPE
jgi:TolB-like protein/Tfp pilus assembly protein PilF